MEIFKCYVPRSEYNDIKIIVNELTEIINAKTPNVSKATTRRYIAKLVRTNYQNYHGVRSVKSIVTTLYEQNKRKA